MSIQGLRTRIAYSYIRFSTREQELGSSLKRQVDAAEEWAAKQKPPLQVDKRHVDRGVSGFKLRNVKKGALGLFLSRIKSGEISPGAVLIVESLNRLTRSEPLEAFDLLREIIKAGVEVVTLQDGQRYNSASMREIGPLIHALIMMSGAHKESENKSVWLAKAWSEKRKAAAIGRPLTRQIPAWLEVTGVRHAGQRHDWSNAKFQVVKARADLVVEMFERRSRGWGYRKIASWLNDTGVEVWGRGNRKSKGGWHESYTNKILGNRAVLGEYQPHKLEDGRYSKRVPTGEVIKDFYPRIVSDELWHSSRAHIVKGETKTGRPSSTAPALFTGLVVDPAAAPMHIERKGDGCDYLATSRAHRRKGKPSYRWRLEHLEKAVFTGVCTLIDWSRVLRDDTRQPELRKLRATLGALAEEEAGIKKKLARAAKALLDDLGDLGTELKKQADELTQRRAAIEAERTRVEQTIHEISGRPTSDGGFWENVREVVRKKNLSDLVFREKFAGELRRVVTKIQIWPTGDVPGVPAWFIKAVREKAAEELTGNRGLAARESGHVVGAIALTLINGHSVAFWTNYRVGARVLADPVMFEMLPADAALMTSRWAMSGKAKNPVKSYPEKLARQPDLKSRKALNGKAR